MSIPKAKVYCFIPSSIDILQYFIVSISLTISLFSPERVEYSVQSENSPHVCSEKSGSEQAVQWLEPTIVGTNYRAKAPRFSHLDCGVIEQKYWTESTFIKAIIVFLMR
jgi:hypothetical protein